MDTLEDLKVGLRKYHFLFLFRGCLQCRQLGWVYRTETGHVIHSTRCLAFKRGHSSAACSVAYLIILIIACLANNVEKCEID